MRYYDLDGQGNVLGSYQIPQPGLTLEFLAEPPGAESDYRWDGAQWVAKLGQRKLAAAELLTALATQILGLSDIIIHAFDEQGVASGYTQQRYDDEIAQRVTLRNALGNRYTQINNATTIAELEALEAQFRSLYQTQLENYATEFLGP